MNKCNGVVGVFNCQGAGWCKVEKKTRIHDTSPGTLTASVCASDVDLINQVAGAEWHGETIVFAYRSGTINHSQLVLHINSVCKRKCFCF
jgi:raffinose synthase